MIVIGNIDGFLVPGTSRYRRHDPVALRQIHRKGQNAPRVLQHGQLPQQRISSHHQASEARQRSIPDPPSVLYFVYLRAVQDYLRMSRFLLVDSIQLFSPVLFATVS